MAYPYLGGAVPSAVPTASTTDNVKKKVQSPTVTASTGINGVNQTTQTQAAPAAPNPNRAPDGETNADVHGHPIDPFSGGTPAAEAPFGALGSDYYQVSGGAHGQSVEGSDAYTTMEDYAAARAKLAKNYSEAVSNGILDPVTANEVNADALKGASQSGGDYIQGAINELADATAGKGVYGIRQLSYKQRQIAAMMPGRSQLSARSAALQGGGTVV